MDKHKESFSEFLKVWFVDFLVLRFLLLLPILLIVTLLVFQGAHKILDLPILLILLLIYYISLIPISKLYIHYRDKRESQKRLEQRDLEEKIFLKNLRK